MPTASSDREKVCSVWSRKLPCKHQYINVHKQENVYLSLYLSTSLSLSLPLSLSLSLPPFVHLSHTNFILLKGQSVSICSNKQNTIHKSYHSYLPSSVCNCRQAVYTRKYHTLTVVCYTFVAVRGKAPSE